MDGVIIESEPCHIKAEIEVFAEQGITLTEDVAKEYFGLKTRDYFLALAKRSTKELPIGQMLKDHSRILPKHYVHVPLVPHAEEVLSILSRCGYKQALATSTEKELAQIPLGKFALNDYFDAKIFGDKVEKGKPHPQIFLEAAKELGVEPQQAIAIEDAENGFKAAKAAGMKVIARKAEHNKAQDFSLADYVISDLREIPKILASLE